MTHTHKYSLHLIREFVYTDYVLIDIQDAFHTRTFHATNTVTNPDSQPRIIVKRRVGYGSEDDTHKRMCQTQIGENVTMF